MENIMKEILRKENNMEKEHLFGKEKNMLVHGWMDTKKEKDLIIINKVKWEWEFGRMERE